MRRKRIAIIEDEPDAREALRTLIGMLCPDIEICGEAHGVESAFILIRNTRPDGILLDISMEDGTGFDLLDRFPKPEFQVIFITAHDEFALKAFRYHGLDYLLKPINSTELAQAIDRINIGATDNYQNRLRHLMESARTQQIDKITLTSQEGMVFLALKDILHLESAGSYTTFYSLYDGKHLIARPMKDFEELLPPEQFFKVHQSHIINLTFVKKILREDGGYVVMEGGFKIPIARRRKEEFIQKIKNL